MKKTIALVVACVTLSAQTQKKITLQKFGENDLLVIHAQKDFSTLIEFPEGPGIQEITCGDREFWVVEAKGRFLHVKPAKEGITTNLNVLLEGDVVYSFLLKEVSKAAVKPDLRIVVNGGDEIAKLRKEKENLEEAFARSERALKDLNDKYEAEKKPGAKKGEPPHQEMTEPAPKKDAATVGAKPLLEGTQPVGGTSAPPAGMPGPIPPLAGGAPAPDPPLIASSYVIERRGGFTDTSKRLFWRVYHGFFHCIGVF